MRSGSGIRNIFDTGSRIQDVKVRIRDVYPGSATPINTYVQIRHYPVMLMIATGILLNRDTKPDATFSRPKFLHF
jgi:hypothetical protein